MGERKERWQSAFTTLGEGILSVVMPCYRLGEKAAENVMEVATFLDSSGLKYEILPVDDGSADGTAEALRAVRFSRPNVIRPVILTENGGKGNALRTGVSESCGSWILLLDGDLDLSISRLPEFFDSAVEHGADIVVGSKRHPKSVVDYPWHRRLASAVYFFGVRILLGVKVTDTQAGMKLFRRNAIVEAMARMLVKTFAFDLEILSIARERGAVIAEAPVELRYHEKFGCLRPSTVKDMTLDTLAVFYRLRILKYYQKVEVPPKADRLPFFSVVIACPKPGDWLRECLSALSRQTYGEFEVIVLPDGDVSEEDGLESCHVERLKVIPTGKVRPAEKRNIGIAAARGDVVAFIDDDAYPDARWLESASKYFAEKSIGALGGPGVTPPGDRFMARAGGRVYENILVSGSYRYRYVGGRVRLDVDDYPSCNLFVRTGLLKAIGGYRTDFWPGEDTLLCEDIVYGQGMRLVYDPWTIVFHHRRPLFAPHLRQLTRYARHRGYFAKRHPKTSLKPAYFAPSALLVYTAAFAAYMAAKAAIGCAPSFADAIAGAPIAVYLLLVAVTSFSLNLALWAVTFAGVIASHFGYGWCFLMGLAASRMPCEYIGKDHGAK